jgi:hypothetical protein
LSPPLHYVAVNNLYQSAQRLGIKVVPVDHSHVIIMEGEDVRERRLKYSDDVMAYNIASSVVESGGKFLYPVGMAHSRVAELLNAPMMIVATPQKSKEVQIDFGINQQDCIPINKTSVAFLKGDIVVAPQSPETFKESKKGEILKNSGSYIFEENSKSDSENDISSITGIPSKTSKAFETNTLEGVKKAVVRGGPSG